MPRTLFAFATCVICSLNSKSSKSLKSTDTVTLWNIRVLNTKLVKHPLNDAHSTLAENIQHIQSSPQSERNSHRQERISKWKIRLCQQCYHWLKRPSVQYFRGLISQSLNVDVATADFLQSLSLIRDHWRLVWRRDPVNADAALRRILRRMLENLNIRILRPVTRAGLLLDPVELANRARAFAGKAAVLKSAPCHLRPFKFLQLFANLRRNRFYCQCLAS